MTLVVLAAGLGSRYGGDKQLDAVGPSGERLLEFTIFDAYRAGFRRVVLVIRPAVADAFDGVADRLPRDLTIEFVEQGPGAPTRTKPWGTAHAIVAAAHAARGPFASVNADDFYGADTFRVAAAALRDAARIGESAVIAFPARATLSRHGPVTRALLEIRGDRLVGIREQRALTADTAPADALVSMNCWIFTPAFVRQIEDVFGRFVRDNEGSEVAELPIPEAVERVIAGHDAIVRVRRTSGRWFGLTHAADRPEVKSRLQTLTDAGEYPSPLWMGTL